MKITPWQLGIQTCARFGSRSWAWSRSRSRFGSGSRNWSRSRSGARSWSWSLIETCQLLASRTQNINLKIVGISALNPRVLIPTQNWQLGFKLRGNQLELSQELEEVSSEFIVPGIPIFVLKEMEMIVGFWRRKVNFCLIGEELWLLFR